MNDRVFGLDAMRASAIFMVLASHLGSGTAFLLALDGDAMERSGVSSVLRAFGFLGVEVFFVLSGFLIGRIVLGIVARGATWDQWLIFLVRRWGRTVPLYLVWAVALLMIAPPAQDVAAVAIRYLTFTQNFASPMPAGNWFGVSWSLPVEEWFYVLFALTVFALSFVAAGRRAVVVACGLFLVLPLMARFLPYDDWDGQVRKVVLMRLDAIAYGVAVALLWNVRRELLRRWSKPMAVVGLCMLAVVIRNIAWMADDAVYGRIVFNIASVGAALCLPAMAGWTLARSVWTAPVTWIAERSYGLYLGHLSILNATGQMFLWGWISYGKLTVTLMYLALGLITEILYRTVEQPILRLRPAQPRPALQNHRSQTQPLRIPEARAASVGAGGNPNENPRLSGNV